ncbi:hypothetical protein [Methylobacterium sp. ID0610]|uniref:hypothetical protein n=1 Tax=Methylobacterium carpenticola TaxID=3344827 RepID=UPI0036A9588A
MKSTNIRLSEGVPDRIDALLGKGRRAEFIREAVLAELERRELEQRAQATTDDAATTDAQLTVVKQALKLLARGIV